MPIIVAGPTINSSAQIAPGTILDSDINDSAAISYSKLALDGLIKESDIEAEAGIPDTKLAQISTTEKVSAEALCNLPNIPPEAGVIPQANLPSSITMQMSTLFEDTGRHTEAVTGSGTATYNTNGIALFAGGGSTGSSNITTAINVAGGDVYGGSPIYSACVAIGDHDSNLNQSHSFFGLGALTVASAGITFTGRHVGFKLIKTGGTISLYATQADGTTEDVSSALTTVVNGDTLDLMFKINDTSTVDYFFRKNGGAISAATTLSSNIPAGTTTTMQHATSNVNTASATTVTIYSAAYSR